MVCTNHTAAAAADEAPDADTKEQSRSLSLSVPPTAVIPYSKEQLLALVDPDPYDPFSSANAEDHFRFFRDPYMRNYAPDNGPELILARTREDMDFPNHEQVVVADPEEAEILTDLRIAVLTRLRSPHKVDLDTIYEIYQRLPEPRIPYIYGRLRHYLLKALGQPARKNTKSMLRYFAVIADVKNNGIALTRAEWNCAISYASRYVGVTTEVEAEAALKLWREMECEAGIKGTDVTFNILFDVASKAGNFPLAEMIYKEMESRGHRFNRYHFVSLIHFFGLKLDGTGIRAAYREMVDAGEIIDTVALNAVISGLLRCGEETAAERVYERMKEAVRTSGSSNGSGSGSGSGSGDGDDDGGGGSSVMPARTYTTDRAITRALLMFAKIGRQYPDMRPTLQRNAPIHPDLHTYRILVNHHAVIHGDLAKVAQYLDEMKLFHIPLHGAIFLALFKGFATHGGVPRSAWSAQRLFSIRDALVSALDDGVMGLEIKTWLVIWVLRAFARCAVQEDVLDVYEDLKARWRLDDAEEQFMLDYLGQILVNAK